MQHEWNRIVTFKGCTETMESVMGTEPISPGIMMRYLWNVVKAKKLMSPRVARQALAGKSSPRPPTTPVDSLDDPKTFKRRRRYESGIVL